MKKYTSIILAMFFGLFLVTSVNAQRDERAGDRDDTYEWMSQQVDVADLPGEVMETLNDEYGEYMISDAFLFTRTEDGAEGLETEREEVERTRTHREAPERPGIMGIFTRDVDAFYEVKLQRGEETRTVLLSRDGHELEHDDDDDDDMY
jgi:hypothetical protein